ncbi:hypothetical protein X737_35790 [Mesorhizobium sp. L48C026A00]|nr:hypothetical protein X737_35790 [Mesorhizobium sp. L48C026A00]
MTGPAQCATDEMSAQAGFDHLFHTLQMGGQPATVVLARTRAGTRLALDDRLGLPLGRVQHA